MSRSYRAYIHQCSAAACPFELRADESGADGATTQATLYSVRTPLAFARCAPRAHLALRAQPAWSEAQLLALIDWFDAGCNSLGAPSAFVPPGLFLRPSWRHSCVALAAPRVRRRCVAALPGGVAEGGPRARAPRGGGARPGVAQHRRRTGAQPLGPLARRRGPRRVACAVRACTARGSQPLTLSESHSHAAEDEAASASRAAAPTVDDETLFALLRAAREAGMQLSRGEAADMLKTQAVPPAVQGALSL